MKKELPLIILSQFVSTIKSSGALTNTVDFKMSQRLNSELKEWLLNNLNPNLGQDFKHYYEVPLVNPDSFRLNLETINGKEYLIIEDDDLALLLQGKISIQIVREYLIKNGYKDVNLLTQYTLSIPKNFNNEENTNES